MPKTVDIQDNPTEVTPLVTTSRQTVRQTAEKDVGSAIRRTKSILKRARDRLGPKVDDESRLDEVCLELEESEKSGNRFFWVAIVFIVNHVLGGVITLHFLEGWSFFDCAYFCIVTTTTVGYGDITPQSKFAKIYVIYYVIVSIGLISTMLAHLIGLLIDQQEEMLLAAITHDDDGDEQQGSSGNETRLDVGGFSPEEQIITATQRLDKSDWYNLIMACCSLLVILLIGFAVFFWMEGLSVVDALYTTIISATTVGFGDFEPTHNTTKTIMTVWLCFSTIAVGKVIADFTDASVKAKQRDVSRRLLTASMDIGSIKSFDKDQSGAVDKCEFLAEMLVRSGKVEREDVDTILLRFEQLDKDNNGEISVADIHAP